MEKNIFFFCFFFVASCQQADNTTQQQAAPTPPTSSKIEQLTQNLEQTKTALIKSAERMQLIKKKIGDNSDPSINSHLSQIESAIRTQHQAIEKWNSKLQAAKQYAIVAGEEHEVVIKTQQELTKALKEMNKMQKAIETDLDYIESQ